MFIIKLFKKVSFSILFVGILIFSSFSVTSQVKHQTLRRASAFVSNDTVNIIAFKAIRYYKEKDSGLYNRIRIYRHTCSDFTFGTDYKEYFNDLSYKNSELIFNGYINPVLGSKFIFKDTTADTDSTYAYWIASSTGDPLGPMPVKVRDMRVWWPYKKVISRLKYLKNKYPKYVKLEKIGYTAMRKPMFGIKIGLGKPVIALVGAIHAGESGPELIIPFLDNLLEQHSKLLNKISVIAIPSANPDSRDKIVHGVPWYIRKNRNGVDLNRNFPAEWYKVDSTYKYLTSDFYGLTYRGPFPGSEPETQTIMSFIKKYKPQVLFSFHCLASIAGETLLASIASKDNKEYSNRCNKFAKIYWGGISPSVLQNEKIHYGTTSGSLPAWCYTQLGIPAFDVEAPFNHEDMKKAGIDHTDIHLLKKYQKIQTKGILNILTNF